MGGNNLNHARKTAQRHPGSKPPSLIRSDTISKEFAALQEKVQEQGREMARPQMEKQELVEAVEKIHKLEQQLRTLKSTESDSSSKEVAALREKVQEMARSQREKQELVEAVEKIDKLEQQLRLRTLKSPTESDSSSKEIAVLQQQLLEQGRKMEELASYQRDKQHQMEMVQKVAELEQELKKLRLPIQFSPTKRESVDERSIPQQRKADRVAVSQQFKEAMAEGFVESHSAKGIMMGAAGSGKTCSLCVILEGTPPPPEERQSTPLAQRPVQAVRFDAKNHSKLRQVKTEEMKRRLAEAINAQAWERKQEGASTTQSESSRPQASSQTPSQMEDAGTQEELLTLIEGVKPLADAEEPLLHSDFVYIVDTGGQPMFHEVLPVFLRNASLCMFVIKLCERLDKIPDIEYFESGSSVCEPVPATQTNEQILEHCVTTIHSHSSSEICPSVLVIGTHRDVLENDIREGRCSETLQEKNQKVREILLPEFERNVVYFSDGSARKRDLIFPINAQNPGKDDWKVAELIRREIMSLIERTPSRPLPLRWYALELTLRDFAEKLGKLLLSWEEAFSVARQLLFTEESFNEAVEYLDDLNIILYYKDILPRVIFCDLSVLIEKISELAKYSYGLRNHFLANLEL